MILIGSVSNQARETINKGETDKFKEKIDK